MCEQTVCLFTQNSSKNQYPNLRCMQINFKLIRLALYIAVSFSGKLKFETHLKTSIASTTFRHCGFSKLPVDAQKTVSASGSSFISSRTQLLLALSHELPDSLQRRNVRNSLRGERLHRRASDELLPAALPKVFSRLLHSLRIEFQLLLRQPLLHQRVLHSKLRFECNLLQTQRLPESIRNSKACRSMPTEAELFESLHPAQSTELQARRAMQSRRPPLLRDDLHARIQHTWSMLPWNVLSRNHHLRCVVLLLARLLGNIFHPKSNKFDESIVTVQTIFEFALFIRLRLFVNDVNHFDCGENIYSRVCGIRFASKTPSRQSSLFPWIIPASKHSLRLKRNEKKFMA